MQQQARRSAEPAPTIVCGPCSHLQSCRRLRQRWRQRQRQQPRRSQQASWRQDQRRRRVHQQQPAPCAQLHCVAAQHRQGVRGGAAGQRQARGGGDGGAGARGRGLARAHKLRAAGRLCAQPGGQPAPGQQLAAPRQGRPAPARLQPGRAVAPGGGGGAGGGGAAGAAGALRGALCHAGGRLCAAQRAVGGGARPLQRRGHGHARALRNPGAGALLVLLAAGWIPWRGGCCCFRSAASLHACSACDRLCHPHRPPHHPHALLRSPRCRCPAP